MGRDLCVNALDKLNFDGRGDLRLHRKVYRTVPIWDMLSCLAFIVLKNAHLFIYVAAYLHRVALSFYSLLECAPTLDFNERLSKHVAA